MRKGDLIEHFLLEVRLIIKNLEHNYFNMFPGLSHY